MASGVIEKLDMPGICSFGVVETGALPDPVPEAAVDDRRVLTPDDFSLSPICSCAEVAAPSEVCDFLVVFQSYSSNSWSSA